MVEKLINPFLYIAGTRSLLLGLLIIMATSVIGYYSHTYFPDTISIKIGAELPFYFYIVQNVLNWFVVSTLFYLASILLSKSSIRMVDIFGTQALARLPYFLASFTGFSGAIKVYGDYLLWTYLEKGEPVVISTMEKITAITLMILSLGLTIWMVTWMFNAFKISANLKGTKLILTFIIVMIISMVVLSYLSNF